MSQNINNIIDSIICTLSHIEVIVAPSYQRRTTLEHIDYMLYMDRPLEEIIDFIDDSWQ